MALLRLISRPNSDTTSLYYLLFLIFGLPGGSDGKESACNVGDTGDAGLNPGLGRSPGRSPGEGNGTPF